jgi:PIN domain nuclease of toxin-antitoxin system
VLDACAMIAYLRDEDGGALVEEYLSSDEDCLAHVVNLCEVYYDFVRADSAERAQSAVDDLENEGVLAREDIDKAFWQEVGRLKATPVRTSLADCFAIALSNRVGGRLLTSDHHELSAVAEQGICEVEFIR